MFIFTEILTLVSPFLRLVADHLLRLLQPYLSTILGYIKHQKTNKSNCHPIYLLYLLPFLTKLNANLQRVNNRVNKYLKTPNSKQIHGVRTAIRRLDAAVMLLPKNNRSHSSLSDYLLKCKEFFKVYSEIRDLDIMYVKL